MAIYQITSRATLYGQEFRNVHYYSHSTTLDALGRQAMVDQLDSEWKTNLQSVLASDYQQYAYDVRQVDVPSLPTETFVPTAGVWNGTNTTGPLPNQDAGLVSFRAPTAPPNKAKTYVGGLTKAAVLSGRWSVGTTNALEAFGISSLTLENVAGENMPRLSARFTNDPPRVTLSNQLATVIVTDIPATQRRRRIGTGS